MRVFIRSIPIIMLIAFMLINISTAEYQPNKSSIEIVNAINPRKVFHSENRLRLYETLNDDSILILFSRSPAKQSLNRFYEPNSNFYYLTGLSADNSVFIAVKSKGSIYETLLTGEIAYAIKLKEITGIEELRSIDQLDNFISDQLDNCEIKYLYMDLKKGVPGEPICKEEQFTENFFGRYPNIYLRIVTNTISNLRMIKSDYEIENIRKAIYITGKGISSMLSNAKAGMFEHEIEAYYDIALKSEEVSNYAFKTIAAAGKNTIEMHYSSKNSKAGKGDLFIAYCGAKIDNYCADITRTFPINGKFSTRQKEIYNIVLKTQLEAIKSVKPGTSIYALNLLAKRLLTKECKNIGLILKDSDITKYYNHNVSHYLGLDTHDPGSILIPLKPGMVITVEPGLYLEEEGMGIRIEDDVLVTGNGCEVLSKDIIKTIEEIEEQYD